LCIICVVNITQLVGVCVLNKYILHLYVCQSLISCSSFLNGIAALPIFYLFLWLCRRQYLASALTLGRSQQKGTHAVPGHAKPANTPFGIYVTFSTNYVGISGTPLTMRLLSFLKIEYLAGAQALLPFPRPKVPARFTMAQATCVAGYSWVC
jgi:hypothetical protein